MLPKPIVAEFTLSLGEDGAFSCSARDDEEFEVVPVSVAVCEVVTDETIAVKLADVAPEGTVTEAGTATALLLLKRLTTRPPPNADIFRFTEQLSFTAVDIEVVAQVILLIFTDFFLFWARNAGVERKKTDTNKHTNRYTHFRMV